jgi:hypothetical protein
VKLNIRSIVVSSAFAPADQNRAITRATKATGVGGVFDLFLTKDVQIRGISISLNRVVKPTSSRDYAALASNRSHDTVGILLNPSNATIRVCGRKSKRMQMNGAYEAESLAVSVETQINNLELTPSCDQLFLLKDVLAFVEQEQVKCRYQAIRALILKNPCNTGNGTSAGGTTGTHGSGSGSGGTQHGQGDATGRSRSSSHGHHHRSGRRHREKKAVFNPRNMWVFAIKAILMLVKERSGAGKFQPQLRSGMQRLGLRRQYLVLYRKVVEAKLRGETEGVRTTPTTAAGGGGAGTGTGATTGISTSGTGMGTNGVTTASVASVANGSVGRGASSATASAGTPGSAATNKDKDQAKEDELKLEVGLTAAETKHYADLHGLFSLSDLILFRVTVLQEFRNNGVADADLKAALVFTRKDTVWSTIFGTYAAAAAPGKPASAPGPTGVQGAGNSTMSTLFSGSGAQQSHSADEAAGKGSNGLGSGGSAAVSAKDAADDQNNATALEFRLSLARFALSVYDNPLEPHHPNNRVHASDANNLHFSTPMTAATTGGAGGRSTGAGIRGSGTGAGGVSQAGMNAGFNTADPAQRRSGMRRSFSSSATQQALGSTGGAAGSTGAAVGGGLNVNPGTAADMLVIPKQCFSLVLYGLHGQVESSGQYDKVFMVSLGTLKCYGHKGAQLVSVGGDPNYWMEFNYLDTDMQASYHPQSMGASGGGGSAFAPNETDTSQALQLSVRWCETIVAFDPMENSDYKAGDKGRRRSKSRGGGRPRRRTVSSGGGNDSIDNGGGDSDQEDYDSDDDSYSSGEDSEGNNSASGGAGGASSPEGGVNSSGQSRYRRDRDRDGSDSIERPEQVRRMTNASDRYSSFDGDKNIGAEAIDSMYKNLMRASNNHLVFEATVGFLNLNWHRKSALFVTDLVYHLVPNSQTATINPFFELKRQAALQSYYRAVKGMVDLPAKLSIEILSLGGTVLIPLPPPISPDSAFPSSSGGGGGASSSFTGRASGGRTGSFTRSRTGAQQQQQPGNGYGSGRGSGTSYTSTAGAAAATQARTGAADPVFTAPRRPFEQYVNRNNASNRSTTTVVDSTEGMVGMGGRFAQLNIGRITVASGDYLEGDCLSTPQYVSGTAGVGWDGDGDRGREWGSSSDFAVGDAGNGRRSSSDPPVLDEIAAAAAKHYSPNAKPRGPSRSSSMGAAGIGVPGPGAGAGGVGSAMPGKPAAARRRRTTIFSGASGSGAGANGGGGGGEGDAEDEYGYGSGSAAEGEGGGDEGGGGQDGASSRRRRQQGEQLSNQPQTTADRIRELVLALRNEAVRPITFCIADIELSVVGDLAPNEVEDEIVYFPTAESLKNAGSTKSAPAAAGGTTTTTTAGAAAASTLSSIFPSAAAASTSSLFSLNKIFDQFPAHETEEMLAAAAAADRAAAATKEPPVEIKPAVRRPARRRLTVIPWVLQGVISPNVVPSNTSFVQTRVDLLCAPLQLLLSTPVCSCASLSLFCSFCPLV